MTDGKEIAALIDELHRIHRTLAELNHRIQRGRRAVAAGVAAQKRAADALAARREEKRNLLLAAKEKERESDAASQELERRRARLDAAKSNREYESIQVQIEAIAYKNDELAEAALEALTVAEEFDAEIEKAEAELKEADALVEKARAAVAETEPKLAADLERARGRLRETEGRLPRDWAGLYARAVKDFDGEDAFAPLTGEGYCGFCRRRLPVEILTKVCGGAALVCPACSRLLYMPEGFVLR